MAFSIFVVIILALCLRVAYIQIVKGEEYSRMAVEKQKRDIVLKPTRGRILDTNGEELAVSVDAFTIWVRKADMGNLRMTKKNDELKQDRLKSKEERFEDNLNTLAELIEKDPKELKEDMEESGQSVYKAAKNLDKETANKIRELRIPGVSITEDARRYYPMGEFLSHTLGSTRDDNEGLSGVELQYNQYLAGVDGRWLKNTDTSGNTLAFGDEKYYKPEDGNDVVLTIDQIIQSYVEKSIRETYEKTKAERVSCLVMDTKTGEILAMGSYPSFNPNNSNVPTDPKEKEEFDKLDNQEKIKYLNEMWRNPFISNNYETGSTMKLITTAAALEEGITSKDDHFNCIGYSEITGVKIKCWSFDKPHGSENLYQGLANSCNPVFHQLSLRLGKEKFYNYLTLFGMRERTDIDFPGEARPIILSDENVKPVELATMGMGQTNAVTPIQLVTAVSAMGNDGKLMHPHILKKIVDKDGKVIREVKPVVVRQAISKETATEMRKIMQYVVDEGTGKRAKIQGYSVGGKTGTSEVVKEGGGYSNEIISSFIGMAPMEDPRFTILYIVDKPDKNLAPEGAAPACGKLLSQILKYKDIKPTSEMSEEDDPAVESVTVPNIKGLKLSEAKEEIEKLGLKYKVTPKTDEDREFIVKEQYPQPNTSIDKNGVVYFYRE